jgi:hypothetical protein
MSFPLLIAQTPRAGRWNHVNLLPGGVCLPADFAPADFLGAASASPVGGNYLAATRVVRQAAGATKEGREVLALVGLRVPDGLARNSLLAWLDARLSQLGEMVTGTDWSAHDGSDYPLAELDDWVREAAAAFGLRPHPTSVLAVC